MILVYFGVTIAVVPVFWLLPHYLLESVSAVKRNKKCSLLVLFRW